MLTREQFFKKYNKKFVEMGGSPGARYQCVDLVNAYLEEVCGVPIVLNTNARDFPSKLTKDFNWFENTATAIPNPGDIVVWQHNQYGHIGIIISAELNLFYSFDQNYPTGSSSHSQQHNYLNPKVAGWLRPKKEFMSELMQIEKTKFEELVNKATKYDDFVSLGFEKVSDIKELQLRIKELEKQISEHECPIIPIEEDTIKWILNGKTEEYIENGKKIIKNYAVDQAN